MASATTTDRMFSIPAYPSWLLTIIAVDVAALRGLCAYGGRQDLSAASMPRPCCQRVAV
jgi:hypothetical protein